MLCGGWWVPPPSKKAVQQVDKEQGKRSEEAGVGRARDKARLMSRRAGADAVGAMGVGRGRGGRERDAALHCVYIVQCYSTFHRDKRS